MHDIDLDSPELCLIDSGLQSLKRVPLGRQLCTLNLHNNSITRIECLDNLTYLRHLDLSSNSIIKIEGLDGLANLKTLNLSCNQIRIVEGLQNLRSLQKIDLSYNQIEDVSGFASLWGSGLSTIHLHGNRITSIQRLVEVLSGCDNIQSLSLLQGQSTNPICQQRSYRVTVLNGLPQLTILDGVNRDGQSVQSSDQLTNIPGLDSYLEYLLSTEAPTHFQSIDSNLSEVITPKIDQVLEKFRNREISSTEVSSVSAQEEMILDRSYPREVSNNTQQGGEENSSRLAILEAQLAQLMSSNKAHAISPNTSVTSDVKDARINKSHSKQGTLKTDDSDSETPASQRARGQRSKKKKVGTPSYRKPTKSSKVKTDSSKSSTPDVSSHRSPSRSPSRQALNPHIVHLGNDSLPREPNPSDQNERDQAQTTYLALMKELETERERRWKAEQAAKKLVDHVKTVQSKAQNESSLQETSVQVNTRLKQVLMNEREAKLRLQDKLDSTQKQLKTVTEQFELSREAEDSQRRALEAMEQTAGRAESERLKQQAHEGKKVQEAQMRASASNREADILKNTATTLKGQVQQLQELLATREQEFRKELQGRYTLDSKELQEVLQREVKKVEKIHQAEQGTLKNKVAELSKLYTDLEDEFRLALQIEANRFHELQTAFEQTSKENASNKQSLSAALKKEERSASMLTELTALVKEQKGRITELSRFKQEQTVEYKERIHSLEAHVEEAKKRMLQMELLKQERIHSLEAHVEEAKKRMLQMELLKQENVKVKAQLDGQESVIEGLRSERKLWGQELATQGASLAQDRGRLESQIETLTSELNIGKKQLERESDSVKIKTKMLEDQTETIRKLKQAIVEREEDIKKTREENLTIQRQLEDQLLEEKTANQELQDSYDKLQSRKEELKMQLSDVQVELEESKKAHSILNKRWKDKSDLIGQLETQVHQMKDTWEAKEKRLIKERDEAVDRASVAIEKLRSVDDAFRHQIDSKQQQHQQELDRLEQEKEEELLKAYQKVNAVEDEMRLLLKETESNKRATEEKMKKLTQAFSDLQSGLS